MMYIFFRLSLVAGVEENESVEDTSNKVVVNKDNMGGVSTNFGSDDKINFG